MRILLVQPENNGGLNRLNAQTPSMALLILGTLAEQEGHEAKLYHMESATESFTDVLRGYMPDIVGITTNTLQCRPAMFIAELVRQHSDKIRIVVGGPHAVEWAGDADDVVIGEGENKWLQILGSGRTIKTIDDVPIPNYDLVDLKQFSGIPPMELTPATAMMLSRGCKGSCIFCNTPYFWGRKMKWRAVDLVIEEVRLLHDKYGIREIFFQDDTFNLNHPWAMAVFEGLIKSGLVDDMSFKLCCRADEKLITKEFLDLAYKAQVHNIFIGVESGSQKMLDSMKKDITLAEIKRAFKMIREANINTQASFIVGLPGETIQTLRETKELIAELNPTLYGWGYAMPFPRTELYQIAKEAGHLLNEDYTTYQYGELVMRTKALSKDALLSFVGY